jgi:hypothetical protein
MDFSARTALVIDQGLYVHVAEKLAQSFGTVLYYCNGWRSAFPLSQCFNIGDGLPGIQRVENPWDHVERADLIVFPDTCFGAEQEYLRRRGQRVWGSGHADLLELCRDELKTVLRSVDLPVGPYQLVTGLEALAQCLRRHPDVFVKGNLFRGDIETFRNRDWHLTKPLLDELASHLGPRQAQTLFVVEEPIPGVETGYDGCSIDGHFPPVGLYGYEEKDAAYVGQVVADEQLPAALATVNRRLGPVLAALGCRGFFSTEVRVGPDRRPYLMDPAMRAGSPPSEAYIEVFANWDEIIWHGAAGEIVPPRPRARYVAEIILRSDWAREHFLPLQFPPALAPFIKLHGHCRSEGQDYAVPLGIREIGGAIGLGDTLEDAIAAAMAHAEAVEGIDVEFDRDALARATEAAAQGREFGIQW